MQLILVSEQTLFRQALARGLSAEGSDVTVVEASSTDEASEKLALIPADVILLQLRGLGDRPEAEIESVRKLCNEHPEVPALVLLNAADDVLMKGAIQAGSAGCLDMSVDVRRVLQALEEAASGEIVLSEALARRAARLLAATNGNGSAHPSAEALSSRELEVLKLLGQGLSNAAIGRRLFVSESTVRAHIRTIMRKLGARNRVQAVARAMALGIMSLQSLNDEHPTLTNAGR